MIRFHDFIRVLILAAFATGVAGCADFSEVVGGKDVRSSEGISKKRDSSGQISRRQNRGERRQGSEGGDDSKEDHAFIWPVYGGRVTSGFGRRRRRVHDGIDIVIEKGTEVMASRGGVVIFSGRIRGYGNLIVLKHPENFFTAYGHLLEIRAKKGERVKQGEVIGLVGRTGRASTPHLHFEIRQKTVPTDPLVHLPAPSTPLPLGRRRGEPVEPGQGEGEDDNG